MSCPGSNDWFLIGLGIGRNDLNDVVPGSKDWFLIGHVFIHVL